MLGFLAVLCSLNTIDSFNLDTVGPVYKRGRDATLFGYSVSQHFIETKAVFLIGAPHDESGQRGTNRSGAMYSCPMNSIASGDNNPLASGDWCVKPLVEYKMGDDDPRNTFIDDLEILRKRNDKDFQLLGATISSSGKKDSNVVVCAPLARFTRGKKDTDPRDITGECFILDNSLNRPDYTNVGPVNGDIKQCLPLDHNNNYETYGQCMQGISAVYKQSQDMLAIGGIGPSTHRGGVYASNIIHDNLAQATIRSTMDLGLFASASLTVPKKLGGFDYLGMSVDVGKFGFPYESRGLTGANGSVTIVSGASRAPYGERHDPNLPFATAEGRVYFIPFDSRRKDQSYMPFYDRYLQGETFGSHFGFSVCAIDIDNDQTDDLVVGAPFHFQTTNDKNSYSGGAIFVYFSQGNKPIADNYEAKELFRKTIKILGDGGSDFGYALTSLGDIDRDTYNDFAVGAPSYDQGRGAVYIYLGNTYEKFDTKWSQIIESSNLPNPLKSFGFSLSGGTDLDNNLYPDLLVGAALSDTALLLRARPIIKLAANIIDINKIRRGDKSLCPNKNWADTCFLVSTELSIFGDGMNRYSMAESLELIGATTLTCKLEVLKYKHSNKERAQFNRAGDNVFEWPCGKEIFNTDDREKKQHVLYLNDLVRDWLRPLVVLFNVSVADNSSSVKVGQPLPRLVPIVDSRSASKEFEIPFDKKCGDDEVCKTDLQIKCGLDSNHAELKDGIWNLDLAKQTGLSTDDIKINITYTVDNQGERAFESQIFVMFEEEQLERPTLVQLGQRIVNLDPPDEENLAQVKTGNPMEPSTFVSFRLSFDFVEGKTKGGLLQPLVFTAIINSTSEEINAADNECQLKIKIIKKAEVDISGVSKPKLLYYGGKIVGGSDMEYEEDIGHMVYHEYNIENNGPWSVSDMTVNVDFPHEVQAPFSRGRWALYPMQLPVLQIYDSNESKFKNMRCEVELGKELINYFGLILDGDLMENIETEEDLLRVKRKIQEAEDSGYHKEMLNSKKTFHDLRRIQPIEETSKDGAKEKVVTISCETGSAKCMKITCKIDYLPRNGVATVKIRSRLWNSTFVQDYPDVTYVRIVSNATVHIPLEQGVQDNITNNYASAITEAYPDLPKIERSQAIPIWIIILAICIGLLLLLLIILMCWRCGFFKRNRKGRDQPNLYSASLHQNEDQWNDT